MAGGLYCWRLTAGEEFGCPQTSGCQRRPQKRPDIVLLAPRGSGGTDGPYSRSGWTQGQRDRQRREPGPLHCAALTGRDGTGRGSAAPAAARGPGFEMASRGAPRPPLIGCAGRCAVQSGAGGGARACPELRPRGSASVPAPAPAPSRHGFLQLPGRRRQKGGEGQEHPGGGAVQVRGSSLGERWGPVRGQAPGRSRVAASGTPAQAFCAQCPGQPALAGGPRPPPCDGHRGAAAVPGRCVRLRVPAPGIAVSARSDGCEGAARTPERVSAPRWALPVPGAALGAAAPRGSGASAEVKLLWAMFYSSKRQKAAVFELHSPHTQYEAA